MIDTAEHAWENPRVKAGPYELIRRLGVGGMGEVWVARRPGLGGTAKTAAIKLLIRDPNRQESAEATAREMFMAEARLSMQLSSSNIVQVFDIGAMEDGSPYMAMEWIDGLNLSEFADRLRERGERMPVPLCAYVVGELLKGLACAHEFKQDGEPSPIIHRDVSPHNVMVSVSGEVKLMDFGIARVATEETSGLHVKGKVRYMPPEHLLGSTREPTVDLFPVGAILHELLDGQKFRGAVADEPRLWGMVIKGEVEPLLYPQDVPPELDELRRALLAPATERIPSARAAFRKLTAWHGYRDAKFDLEELLARVWKPAASMPGAGNSTNPTLPRTEYLPSTSSTNPNAKPGTREITLERAQLDRNREQTDTKSNPKESRTNNAPVTAVEPRRAVSAPASRGLRLLSSGALLLIGVGFGVFGVWKAIGWWSSDDDGGATPTVAASTPNEVVAELDPEKPPEVTAEPAPTPSSEPPPPKPITEPPPNPSEPAQPPKESDLVVEDPPPQPAPAGEPQSLDPPKISVSIQLKGAIYAEVRLGKSKPHTIKKPGSSSATIRVLPGKQLFRWRLSSTGDWSEQTFEIPKHGRVTLEIQGKTVTLK
jgi:serine/threonine protein kinase